MDRITTKDDLLRLYGQPPDGARVKLTPHLTPCYRTPAKAAIHDLKGCAGTPRIRPASDPHKARQTHAQRTTAPAARPANPHMSRFATKSGTQMHADQSTRKVGPAAILPVEHARVRFPLQVQTQTTSRTPARRS